MMRYLFLLLVFVQLLVFSQQEKKYRVKNIGVNDQNTTFSTSYFKDGFVIFTTPKKRLMLNSQRRRIKRRLARMRKKRRERVSKRIERRKHKILRSDLEFYIGFANTNGEIVKAKPLSWQINTTNDELDACFSKNKKTVYFTRNLNSNKKKTHLAIFKADVISAGYWINITKLPFNSKDFSVGYPTLSSDERFLYFASDRDGSLDIFKVKILGENSFSEPINLGSKINTDKTETTPFIKNDTLYFSSNGRKGFGKLDVFYIDVKQQLKVKNLGKDINSTNNDFAFKINTTGNFGYFTSDRPNGKGKNDSYFFKEIIPKKPKKEVTIKKKNVVKKKPIPKRKKEKFILAQGNKLTEKEYERCSVLLENVPNILFDYDKSYIRADAARILDEVIHIMNRCPNIHVLVSSHTDSRSSASYNKKLSQKRAQSTVNYILRNGKFKPIRVKGIGYGESRLKNKCADGIKCTPKEHEINRRTEFEISNFY